MLTEIYPFNKYDDLNELAWINMSFNEEEMDSVQKGLQKSDFEFAKGRSTGKIIIPEIRCPKKKTQEQLWEELIPNKSSELT